MLGKKRKRGWVGAEVPGVSNVTPGSVREAEEQTRLRAYGTCRRQRPGCKGPTDHIKRLPAHHFIPSVNLDAGGIASIA